MRRGALRTCVFCRKFKWSISAFFNLADVSLAAGPAKCYLALEITFHLEKQHKVSLGNDSGYPYWSVLSKTWKVSILALLSGPKRLCRLTFTLLCLRSNSSLNTQLLAVAKLAGFRWAPLQKGEDVNNSLLLCICPFCCCDTTWQTHTV